MVGRMSSALAIAAVTSALKHLLDNHLAQHSITARVGDVSVTALPPDRLPTGADERSGLNLFLYHVTPHARWVGNGHAAEQSAEPPRPALRLDLHYLLAAYGQADFQAEILLGYAIQLLLETPALTSDILRAAVEGAAGNGSSGLAGIAAAEAGTLVQRLGSVAITPEFLNSEETTKLWSALQARYRPSAVYKDSAVVIEAGR